MTMQAMQFARPVALMCGLLLAAMSAGTQQTDVKRFDVYAGPAGFETPWLNLAQRGWDMQAGENLRPWSADSGGTSSAELSAGCAASCFL